MIETIRTTFTNSDFGYLVSLLDQDLKIRDGDEHAFYSQFNKIDKLQHAVVAYKDGVAIGSGALRQYDNDTVEIKRMFVKPECRGHGIAGVILSELEAWAKELSFSRCILETGKKQPEAIALYLKSGYAIFPCYGQYQNVDNSICMEKKLK
jgi:putative acetyltransferase